MSTPLLALFTRIEKTYQNSSSRPEHHTFMTQLKSTSTPSTSQHHASTDPENFQTDQVFTVATGHFFHDAYTGFLPALLPLLQERLGSTYAGTGGLLIFTQIPSILTPFIGYLADKVSLRYFVILAPAVTGTLMGLIGLTSNYLILAMLLLAVGVSVACFHAPAPAMIARLTGNRVGTGMSIFMAAGELGRTVGPIVAVAGVGWFGLEGVWRLAVISWFVSAVLYLQLRQIPAQPQVENQNTIAEIMPRIRRVFGVITWLMFPRIFLLSAITIYLPLFMRNELETSIWLAAMSLTILEGAGVIGALLTGTISDHLGRPRMLLILLTLSPILLALFLFGPAWLTVPMLIALGLTAISPTPVLLATVQDQFPDNRSVANGIFMLLNFTMRAIGIWVVGALADQYGLMNAFTWCGIFALVSIPATFWLPEKAQDPR